MDLSAVEMTVSSVADLLHTRNGLGDVTRLGQTSLEILEEACAKISTRYNVNEARLMELVAKLDAEEARTKELEERLSHASNDFLETELWLTRVTDAIKCKLARWDGPQIDVRVAA
jgi:chromosome segregation ATPase